MKEDETGMVEGVLTLFLRDYPESPLFLDSLDSLILVNLRFLISALCSISLGDEVGFA